MGSSNTNGFALPPAEVRAALMQIMQGAGLLLNGLPQDTEPEPEPAPPPAPVEQPLTSAETVAVVEPPISEVQLAEVVDRPKQSAKRTDAERAREYRRAKKAAQAATVKPPPLNEEEKRNQFEAKLHENVVAFSQKRLVANGHEQWPLPPEAGQRIVVYGECIWPTTDRRYDWHAAYYGFNLWMIFDKAMREQSSVAKGRLLMNPIGPILCHICGPVGVVIQKIGDAMCQNPGEFHQVQGPGKTLQGGR